MKKFFSIQIILIILVYLYFLLNLVIPNNLNAGIIYSNSKNCSYIINESSIPIPEYIDLLDISNVRKKLDRFTTNIADTVYIYEVNSGISVYEKNIEQQRMIASLTKLMTTAIVIDKIAPNTIITVPDNVLEYSGSIMNLTAKEEITAKNVLTGLLVKSANDAALTFAENISGSVDDFVKIMNDKAISLNMHSSSFSNPAGYDSTLNYSSAKDLKVLIDYIMQNQIVKDIVKIKEITVYSENKKYYHFIKSTNSLLFKYKEISGIKTGTTEGAGQNLIFQYDKGLTKYNVIILSSQDRFSVAEKIISLIK